MIKCLLNYSFKKMSTNSGKGVPLEEITTFLKTFAPISLAETWDNVGLLAEPTIPRAVENVLLTIDLTEDVVMEAVDSNVGLIISYHPPIFKGLTKITSDSWKERIICRCLENRIAIFSPHTTWDCVPGGVNDWLASCFEIQNIKPITENPELIGAGAGRYCELKHELKLSDAVQKVKALTSLKTLNLVFGRGSSLDTKINDVAICAGSGSSVLAGIKAGLYLTGEMSHHSLLDAMHQGTNVILCNHSNSERGFLTDFARRLKKQFTEKGVEVTVSEKDKDPIQCV